MLDVHIIVNKTNKVVSGPRPYCHTSDSQSMSLGDKDEVVDGISARCVCIIRCLLIKNSVFNPVPLINSCHKLAVSLGISLGQEKHRGL